MSRAGRAIAWPAPAALALAAAAVLLLALAPPARNAFWAVNGLRTVAPGVALGLALAAAAAGVLALRPPRGALAPALLAVALAAALAFPLRERFHFLGDTDTRMGTISDYARGVEPQPLAAWARALHAQPLDALTGLVLPAAIGRRAGDEERGVSWVSLVLALIYMAGAWRLARTLAGDSPGEPLLPLALALVAWGGLEAFAGYAESAGVALAAGVWWWAAMLRPLARPRDAAGLVIAWLFVFAAHRVALVLLLPQLVRLLARPLAGDATGPRRAALGATVLAGVLAVLAQRGLDGGRTSGDFAELLRGPAADALGPVPIDLANLAALIAPLLLLAAALAGAVAWRRAAGDPRAPSLVAAVLVLLPTAFPLPVAASGLGVQRDWDLSILFGLSLAATGAFVLSRATPERRRGVLALALPVLVLLAGGWVAVNADARATETRARALREAKPSIGASATSSLLVLLAARELKEGRAGQSALDYEASWRLVPSPARGLHGVMAWLYARDPANARRLLAEVRARGALPERRRAEADSLETWIGQVEERLRALRAAVR